MTVHPEDTDPVDGSDTEDPLAVVVLMFVYNADSGVMNALRDYVHKNVSPSTYGCNLCALTYGSLGMHSSWSEFVDGLGVSVEFLHRDELKESHGVDDVLLPTVMVKEGTDVRVLIPANEINDLWTLDELKGLVSSRVRELREARDD